MRDYFIRRILLIPPTLLGVTLVVFFITRITPGGPLERRMQEAVSMTEGSGSSRSAGGSLTEDQKEQLNEYYGFDVGFFHAWLRWLGVLPYEKDKVRADFENQAISTGVTLRYLLPREEWTESNAYATSAATVTRDGYRGYLEMADDADRADAGAWRVRVEQPKDADGNPDYSRPLRAVVFRPVREGLLQGNLGISTRYNDRVWDMIRERFPVSLFYGILTFLITYSICLPLGIVKAIRHRTFLDNATSVLIFVGYAIPGFVLGSILVVFLAARAGWFPAGGFVSPGFADLSVPGKALDLLHHAVLPLVCYVIGSFAFTTMLLKNNLLDNLAADYIRTAIAKGCRFRTAVIGHALRNSLIPVLSTLGDFTMLLVTGSILIERIFDINGFGLLSYSALLDRDFPVVMGVVTLSALLLMIGNILSDLFVAAADPRIRFR